ncbi:MAG: SIS domain-containing protein [Candidatus Acidiferrales bacterium]
MAEVRTAHPYHVYDAIERQPALIEKVLQASRGAIERAAKAAAGKRRIIFAGIGTSLHAARVAEGFLRHLTAGRAEARAEQSFEFTNYPLALSSEDAVVAITHTGTTRYSLAAIEAAKRAGAVAIAVVGEASGEGTRRADFVIETCEQEVAFAYTKSYTAALAALALFAIRVAALRNMLADAQAEDSLLRVPGWVRESLAREGEVRSAALEIAQRERIVIFGAGPAWPTACEAALKIKEACYIAAEGFETEEILHGPFSEIDSRAAMMAILTGGEADERARTILRAAGELKMLRVAVAPREANHDLAAEHVLETPAAPEWLAALTAVTPLYLATYHIALARGINPDTGRQDQPPHAAAHKLYKL